MVKAITISPKTPLSKTLRLRPGVVSMDDLDPRARPGFPGEGKGDAPQVTEALEPELSTLQEQLHANSAVDPSFRKRILLVLQGMDTSGKGGVIRHSIGMVEPQGVQLTSFKAPTVEERAHHFLWRIEKAVPDRGKIGVFDRSHYEDVLIVRVDNLAPLSEWSGRYDQINDFEKRLVDDGVTIVKCFLNVSFAEQKSRLAARLARPDKYWKFNPADVDARRKWSAYQEAYRDALERCNTEHAPWFVVPSDRKWYRNWAVAELLREHLIGLDLSWPEATFDVAEQKARLAAS